MSSSVLPSSPALAELTAFCEAMSWPATDYDRRTFEALFRCVSSELSMQERGEIERLARHYFMDGKGLAKLWDLSG